MTERTRQFCRFVAGPEEYTGVEPAPATLERLANGMTLGKARACHPNGERVKWGTAYSTPDGLELYYQTACAGDIEFEQHAVNLEFHLTALPFDPKTTCRLVHDPDGHLPRDIAGINEFDEYAIAFGWIYDNGWRFEDEPWQCYGGPKRFDGYVLLRQPPERTVLIAVGDGTQRAVWRGEVRTTLDFDAMRKAFDDLHR